MPNPKKAETIDWLAGELAESKLAILADYRGLTVADMTELRKRLRQSGGDLHVAKNTLTRIAAEKIGVRNLAPLLEGPTAIAFVKGEPAPAAKALGDYVRTAPTLKIKGGVMDGRAITADDIKTVATLPPMATLRARLLGNMQGPMAGFVSVLSASLGGLVRVLQARAEQLQPAASAETA